MASVTLAEAAKLTQDKLVEGVIENIVTVNQMYSVLPFSTISGATLRYNREKTLGNSQTLNIGDTITAKAPAAWKEKYADLTTLIGDAEVNNLLVAQRVGPVVESQIASKAKSVGRQFQDLMVNGDKGAVSSQFDGLEAIIDEIDTEGDNTQTVAAGGALTFELLDELLHLVKAKDGAVDFLMMHSRDLRKVRSLMRALGGANIETVQVNGVNMEAYAGVPIFRNDWIPTNQGGGTESAVYAGTLDDGSQRVGISGLTSEDNSGIHIQEVGASETKDEDIYRVKFYSSFAAFSELGVARITGITP